MEAVGQTPRPEDSPHPNPSPEEEGLKIPDELRVFDYIYIVLHSPDYRRTYAQFLKIDFARIPYPASPEVFAHIAEMGGSFRRLHLMQDAAIGATPYPFKGTRADGDDNVVVKPAFVSSPPVAESAVVDSGEDQGGERAASAALTSTVQTIQPQTRLAPTLTLPTRGREQQVVSTSTPTNISMTCLRWHGSSTSAGTSRHKNG